MITKTSVPGKTENGYILLDILVLLLVVSIGFGSIFGALRTVINSVVKQEQNFMTEIGKRNEQAVEFQIQIQKK